MFTKFNMSKYILSLSMIYVFYIFTIFNYQAIAKTSDIILGNNQNSYYINNYYDETHVVRKIIKRDIESSVKNVTNSASATTPITPLSNQNLTLVTTSVQAKPNIITTQPTNSYDARNKEEDDLNLEGLNNSFAKDNHKYYRSFSKKGVEEVSHYWVDLHNLPQEKVVSHDTLSSAHRRALTVALSFEFPFYGHVLHNVTIATGGFLFTGAFLHKWLAATQYIAPLMANFDTSVSPEATVKYADNGTSLTVQWENVVLQDNPKVGAFTFQVTIHKTGHIVFAYKDVPVTVTLIGDVEHPVKVGLSDAYIVEKTIFYVRKKTIYEYHKIDMKTEMKVDNWTALVFEPLPNCVFFKNCKDCLLSETEFECEWCPEVNRCSDGLDRHRQDWLEGQCDRFSIKNVSQCAFLPVPAPSPSLSPSISGGASELSSKSTGESGSSNAAVGVLLFVLLMFCIGAWVAYAYFYPHSPSGQLLIKYRPSAWSWRRGEARYTAATMHSIHM